MLLTGPAVRAVAASGADVHMLCGPRGAEAAGLLPGVGDCTVFHAPWIEPEHLGVDAGAIARLVRLVATLRVDEAIVFTSFHQSALPLALLLRMARVPRIAAISEDFPGSLLDVRHHVDEGAHEVERNLSLVEAVGYRLPAGDDGALRVALPLLAPGHEAGSGAQAGLPATGRAAQFFASGESYVVVHPGASVPARAWAPARAAELVADLVGRGQRVAVTGGSHERALTSLVARAGGDPDSARAVDLGGSTDLAGLARVLAGARAVVVGNTGPAHLAAAVGTPVVSLYAPTVPAERWAPWRVRHVLLGDHRVPCAGCRSRTCPVPGHPCLDELPARIVADAVDMLAGTAGLARQRPARAAAVTEAGRRR